MDFGEWLGIYGMLWLIWLELRTIRKKMKCLASFMIAIFFAAFGYLVWDKISAPLSEKIFTEVVVGICGMVVCGYTFMIADDC